MNLQKERGIEATGLLEELELGDQRLLQSFISVAGAGGIMTDAIGVAGEAWEDNTALTEEARKRYETTEEQLKILKNTIVATGIDLGERLLPHIKKLVDYLKDNQDMIIKVSIALAGLITVLIGLKSALMIIETIKGVVGAMTLLKVASGSAGAAGAIAKLTLTIAPFLVVASAAAIAVGLLMKQFAGLQQDTEALNTSLEGLDESIKMVDEKINAAADEETRQKWIKLKNELEATKKEASELSKISFKNLASGFRSKVRGFLGLQGEGLNLLGLQHGGSISGGQTAMVGEAGPERITPRILSTVTPNNQTTSNTISINFGGVSVRNENDITSIIDKIKEALSRDGVLAEKGAL